MDQDKLFDNITEGNDTLWERLTQFADELDLQPLDEQVFYSEEQARLSTYINGFFNNIISVGVHLARIKKVKTLLSMKVEALFDDEYVRITNECVSGANSSKFDKEYRGGKARQVKKYKELSKLLAEVTELEGILNSVKDSFQVKAMVIPTLFKLDKKNIYE